MMFLKISAQDKVYDKDGNSHIITESQEILKLEKSNSSNEHKLKEFEAVNEKEFFGTGLVATLLPIAIDAIFDSTEKYLEKREKSFVGEYATSNSYLHFSDKDIPKIVFTRSGLVDGTEKELFNLTISSLQPDSNYPLAFFYVENLQLNYSKARTKKGKSSLDYTIEITPKFLKVLHEKKGDSIIDTKIEESNEIKIDPIKMRGIGFKGYDENVDKKHLYRTGFFTLPKNHIVAGVQIKIIESNPAKIGAEKILAIFNQYKDEAKTIINNYIPEKEKNTEGNINDGDNTETVGNK